MHLTNKIVNKIKRQNVKSENSVERKVYGYAKELGFLCPKLSTPGQRSWPDRAVFMPGGLMFFMEFKKPVTGRLSPGQEKRIPELREMGYTVYVVDNVLEGTKYLKMEKAVLDIHMPVHVEAEV